MWRAYKETEGHQYFPVEVHDKDEPKITWNSDGWGWDRAGQQLLMPRAGRQQGSSIRAVMLGLSSSSGSLDFCSWARGLRSHGHPQGAAGCCVMERVMEITRGAGGCGLGVEERTRVLWRGKFGGEKVAKDLLCHEGYRWSGAKKLPGSLCLVKSPEDGNMKPGPRCRVLAQLISGHVSRQVRRGPHVLWRRCHAWQSWSNVFRVKHMPDLRGVKGEVSSKKLQVLPAWQGSKVLGVLPAKTPQERWEE